MLIKDFTAITYWMNNLPYDYELSFINFYDAPSKINFDRIVDILINPKDKTAQIRLGDHNTVDE